MAKKNSNIKEEYKPAPIFKRVIAYAIDILIYVPFAFLFMFFSKIYVINNDISKSYFMLLCLLIVSIGLFSYMPKKLKGQTIGKKIMRIKIQHVNEKMELSYWKYFLREYFAKIGIAIFVIPMTIIYAIISFISKKKFPQTFILDDFFSVRVVELKK